MSLYGVLNSSVAGMAAQSNRLGSVADNIANASTTGYKRIGTEFETIVGLGDLRDYASGGVRTDYRTAIGEQGTLQSTSNPTDLAIQGSGFFLVARPGEAPVLTRAGAFNPDSQGYLVNSAGYRLLGVDTSHGGGIEAAGLQGLAPVLIDSSGLSARPSTAGQLSVNLPATAATVDAAHLPSANAANATWTAKTSMVARDNLGGAVPLDVYFSKTADNTWEAAVYNRNDSTHDGFPYSSPALTTESLAFDPTTGRLATAATGTPQVSIPNGADVPIDLSGSTQFAASFALNGSTINGNAPAGFDHVEVANDGALTMVYRDGSRVDAFRIPVANVVAPNNLRAVDGNAFAETAGSGNIAIGLAGSANFGRIAGSALENSTVDLASELTTMIQAQRSYTANSKVFQTGTDMLDVISNLKV